MIQMHYWPDWNGNEMGLNCSHDAFDGNYGAFSRLRKYVAKVAGGSYPPHDEPEIWDNQEWWYYDHEIVPSEHHEALESFLGHADHEGDFTPEQCWKMAEFLKWIYDQEDMQEADGVLARVGPHMRDSVKKFKDGCVSAYVQNEPLTFG